MIDDRFQHLVLADLDGNWETLYHEPETVLPSFHALFPNHGKAPYDGETPWYEESITKRGKLHAVSDFFFVHDGHWEVSRRDGKGPYRVRRIGPQNAEITADDARSANPIARPEIYVGRINPYFVALRVKDSLPGIKKGERLLVDGKPATVHFRDGVPIPRNINLWEPDARLEIDLLLEYFDRNHRYRRGAFRSGSMPASFNGGWSNDLVVMKKMVKAWKTLDPGPNKCHGKKLTLLQFINWMKRPAVIRSLKAHSNPRGIGLKKAPAAEVLKALGGKVPVWHGKGRSLIPGFAKDSGKVSYPILRALHDNDLLPDTPCFYIHTGCNSVSPGGSNRHAYTRTGYALWQHQEALLFFGGGLANIARSKGFYDSPAGFYPAFLAGKTFGEGWINGFLSTARNKRMFQRDDIGRKRSYWWSVTGDPTLKFVEPLPVF